MSTSQDELEVLKLCAVIEEGDLAVVASAFNRTSESNSAVDRLVDLVRHSPATALARSISQIVETLRGLDATEVEKAKKSWFRRFTGEDLEREIWYQVQKKNVDATMLNAEKYLSEMKAVLAGLAASANDLQDDIRHIEIQLEACNRLLNDKSHTEQEARRLNDEKRIWISTKRVNLQLLNHSSQMSLAQMRMALDQGAYLEATFLTLRETFLGAWQRFAISGLIENLITSEGLRRALDEASSAVNLLKSTTPVDEVRSNQ